ncbi:hypothetical protein EV424DRAFT_1349191 [Suillus variegatus]|nr:hypothetical protein EV424DRAFT_1349191 [Suillus variegatus]
MCQTKWTSIYNVINKYCKQSGINQWHPEYGANIQGEAAVAVFDVYVQQKSNSAMHPFRNSRWVYLEQMQEILPIGGAQAPGSTSSMNAIAGTSGRSTSSTSTAAGTSGDVTMSRTNTIASSTMPPPSGAPTRPTISTTSSTGKRSHNATSMFHDDATTFASTVPSLTSEWPQQSEA